MLPGETSGPVPPATASTAETRGARPGRRAGGPQRGQPGRRRGHPDLAPAHRSRDGRDHAVRTCAARRHRLRRLRGPHRAARLRRRRLFTVESTHGGTTTIDAGARRRHDPGPHHRGPHPASSARPATTCFRVGTTSHLLDLLAALLVLDGGAGHRHRVASTTRPTRTTTSAGSTQGTLTGLDMVARPGGDDAGPAAGPDLLRHRQAGASLHDRAVAGRRRGRTGVGAATFALGAPPPTCRPSCRRCSSRSPGATRSR